MKKQISIIIIITTLFIGTAIGILIARYSGNTTIILAKHWLEQDEATVTVPPNSLGKININTADVHALCNIPGIGETTAKKIIYYRNKYGPFVRVEDLLKIDGFGNAKLNSIKDYITVSNGG